MFSYPYFSLRLFILFLILLLPIFVNLSIDQGVRFDADPFNYLGKPSLPLSLFFFIGFTLFYVAKIRFTWGVVCCIAALLFYLLANFLWAKNIRPFFLFLGMLVPLLNYFLVKACLNNKGKEYIALDNFFYALCSMLIVKFISDVIFFDTVFSKFFLSTSVVIYSYHDYFLFVYLLALLISFWMLSNGRHLIMSLFISGLSITCLLLGHSRLYFFAGLFSLPLFILIKYSKLSTSLLFYSLVFLVTVITLLVGFIGVEDVDPSFDERFSHWYSFFYSFSPGDLFFPFMNIYRQSLNTGTFHNELLEIYSYFGLAGLAYLLLIGNLFSAVDNRYRTLMKSLLVILVMGMLIQMNFTNPYLGILWSTLLAIVSLSNNSRCNA